MLGVGPAMKLRVRSRGDSHGAGRAAYVRQAIGVLSDSVQPSLRRGAARRRIVKRVYLPTNADLVM